MRIYYRGTKKDGKRVLTGNKIWDNNLFCSIHEDKAKLYGPNIEQILLKREANVLTEGTKVFNKFMPKHKANQSLLDWCASVLTEAKALKYHVVEFKRQGDVGTVIMDETMIIRNFNRK